MDELMRAVEATLFASSEPLTVDELAAHVGEGEIEIANLPGRLANEPQSLRRAAYENVATDTVPPEQPGASFAHRVEPLQTELEPKRDLFGAWVLLRVLGQQQAGFKVSEPCRHHQIIGSDLQLQCPGPGEVGQILLDQLEDRDLREVDLLRPGEIEQQVERPFPPVEGQIELIRLAYRR